MGRLDNDDPIDEAMESEFSELEKDRFKYWLKDLTEEEFKFVDQEVKIENARRKKKGDEEQHWDDESNSL